MDTWAIIHNPKAGRFRPSVLEAIGKALREGGVRARMLPTEYPGHATELARAAEGVASVAVYGGDGTLNEAANGMLGREVPLAFLPGGTANVMALEQGLPPHPVRAARALLNGGVRPVRPGMLEGRCFLLMAGFGFDADAVHGVNLQLKKRLGKGAYVISGLRAMLKRRQGMRVHNGGGAPQPADWVVASRAFHYAGHYVLHPEAGLEAPALGLVVVRPGGVPAFLFGRMRMRLPFRSSMSLVSERGCRIEADAPVHAQIDGDYFGRAAWFRVGLAEQELLLRFPGE